MYDLVGGGFHRYSVDDAAGSCRTSRRCSTTTRCSSPRTCTRWLVTGEERYREVVERDARLRAARAARCPSGGFASAQDADTDGVEGLTFTWTPRTRASPRASCCSRSSTAARSSAASSTTRRGRGCSRARERRPQPAATTRRSPPGTASRSPRSPRPGGGSTAPTGSTRRRELARVPARAALATDGRLHRTWRDGRASGTGYLEDYANVAHGLLRAARRDRRAALARGGAPARAARGRALRRRRARRLLPRRPPTASSSSRARRTSTTTRSRPATRCSPTSCCGSRGSTATTSSSGARSACSGSLARRLGRGADRRSAGRSARSTSTSRRRASSRSSARPTSEVARAALAPFDPNAVVAFGPAEDVPLLAGKDAGRRQAGGLRLRALRLPAPGHELRGACGARR